MFAAFGPQKVFVTLEMLTIIRDVDDIIVTQKQVPFLMNIKSSQSLFTKPTESVGSIYCANGSDHS